jgi:hypothetical protein
VPCRHGITLAVIALKETMGHHKTRLRFRFSLAGGGTALAVTLAVFCAAILPAFAEHTRFWRESGYTDFEPGTAHGVALRSDGKLTLAPNFSPFADPNLGYLWALRMDSKGNLYAAGGSNAKVVRFDAAGKATTVFESDELTAQTLLLDKNDNLYVGTSPDGKVYKVTRDGQKSVFFDPKTKYIWDLALGADGTLYVATGDTGKIFAVSPTGKSEQFYSADETHIRALALDGKGNLLAGTEPNGLVLRIPIAAPTGSTGRQAYVLYETARQEVTALATDAAGNLYVAGIGDKNRGGAQGLQTAIQPLQPAATAAIQSTSIVIGGAGAQTPAPAPAIQMTALGASSVYRIAPDGSPDEIWTARQTAVYALSVSPDGGVLVGIGNQGGVLQLQADGVFSRLAKTESAQVTGLLRAPNGTVYIATANPGKVFAMGPELESEGSFESQTFDARIFSRWGRLTWWAGNAAAGDSSVELYVRAGNTSNPEKNWSAWSGPYRDAKGAEAECPAARFAQWKVVLHGGKKPAPELSWVNLAYLPKNIAPEIEAIAMQNPGIRIPGPGAQIQAASPPPAQLRMPAAVSFSSSSTSPAASSSAESSRYTPTPQAYLQKGYQSVVWDAEDANDDALRYAVYFRGEGEKDWKLLKDKLDDRYYSWDTTAMPDGAYTLKIVASDAASNPPGEALEGEQESDRFVVDNTPPDILSIAADAAAGGADPSVTVRVHAKDATSAIVRAQYSLDAGDWMQAVPSGGLSDSPEEQYAIALHNLSPGEHTVTVRVFDQFENLATSKVTFNAPGAAAQTGKR